MDIAPELSKNKLGAPPLRSLRDWLLLIGFCGFLLFFGLAHFGLVGADEPRYAQVAREMFDRHDWITPTLGGKPWLEKPVLYYWEAIVAYRFFGVSDWAAFLKRSRPAFALDGALMAASAAGTIGFARAAATDMPLASMFAIGMLAWYAWYESGSKRHLALFYLFLGLGALAKGPIAVFLAMLVIGLFILAKSDHQLIRRTLWIPGILIFCAVTLPWYIAVQLRNPEFFRVFILEHNLARFGTNLYHHPEPFWYYLPVLLLGLLPWTVFAMAALAGVLRSWSKERRRFVHFDDAFSAFLAIWLIAPVVFFSISQSKLPGYILPALPPGILLVSEHLRRRSAGNQSTSFVVIVIHSIVAAAIVVPALLIQFILLQRRLPWNAATMTSCSLALILAIAMALTLRSHYGLRMLRFVSLVPVILAVTALLRIGAPALDNTLSARPVSQQIRQLQSRPVPIALFLVSRETEYGLNFYQNQALGRYELSQVPSGEHLVIAPSGYEKGISKRVPGRRVAYMGSFAPQHLDFFWVAAK